MELSDADNRVLNYLRERRRKTSSIARDCFATRNPRPAAAHLARMKQRGLVQEAAGYWEITEHAAHPSPELPLGEHQTNTGASGLGLGASEKRTRNSSSS